MLWLFLSVSLFVSACVAQQPLGTASGKPEVILPHLNRQQARDHLVNDMIGNGYELKRSDEYALVFGKRTNSAAAAMLFGSRYDSTPEERVIVNTLDTQGGVRLIFTLQIVTNPGSAFERVTDNSRGKAARDLQQILDAGMATVRARTTTPPVK